MSEETESEVEVSPEAEALREIAGQISAYRKEHRKPKAILGGASAAFIQDLTGVDLAEARERERDQREREQVRLYKLVILIAAISALASIASVIVAVING